MHEPFIGFVWVWHLAASQGTGVERPAPGHLPADFFCLLGTTKAVLADSSGKTPVSLPAASRRITEGKDRRPAELTTAPNAHSPTRRHTGNAHENDR
jgi:hypothetical protein